MSFNINNFKQNIDYYGYAKSNKFEVFVQTPKFLQNKTLRVNNRVVSLNGIGNLLRHRIEQVKTPSVSLMSIDANRFGIGPTQKMPFNAQFFDTTFSVLLDRNTDIFDFWYAWTNGIFNFNGTEPNGNNPFIGSNRIPSYTVEYKDEYSTNMMIVIYDQTGRTVKTINLYEAFPSSIRELNLGWNDNANLLRLAISITYSNYSIVGSNMRFNGIQDIPDDSVLNPEIQNPFIGAEVEVSRPYNSQTSSTPSLSPVVNTKDY